MAPNPDRLPPPSADLPDTGLAAFIAQLRARDPAFAEASVLHPDEMGEWQAAVYLLTGCEPVWGALGAAVMADRSMLPVHTELHQPTIVWAQLDLEVMAWVMHLWDYQRNPAELPYFDRPLFDRWIIALHLRQGLVPAVR